MSFKHSISTQADSLYDKDVGKVNSCTMLYESNGISKCLTVECTLKILDQQIIPAQVSGGNAQTSVVL